MLLIVLDSLPRAQASERLVLSLLSSSGSWFCHGTACLAHQRGKLGKLSKIMKLFPEGGSRRCASRAPLTTLVEFTASSSNCMRVRSLTAVTSHKRGQCASPPSPRVTTQNDQKLIIIDWNYLSTITALCLFFSVYLVYCRFTGAQKSFGSKLLKQIPSSCRPHHIHTPPTQTHANPHTPPTHACI